MLSELDMMKRCAIIMLPGTDLKPLVVSPRKTIQTLNACLKPYGPEGQGYFYRYDLNGFFDGVLWGLMRIKGPGNKLQYQDLRVWTEFVRVLSPSRLNMYLGLLAGTPKVDTPEVSIDEAGLPTVFTLCRNLMPVGLLVEREDPFIEISAVLDGNSKWIFRSDEFGRGRAGLAKWVATAIPTLHPFASTHFALSVTLQMGSEPVIPTNENPREFTAPEEPRY